MGQKYERKYLAHYIDASFGGSTANYVRLGKDLEEYNIEMNAETETKRNILGETSTKIKGYEPSGDVDTYYAEEGDALFTHLSDIVNNRSTGSELETTVIDVLVNSSGTVVWAFRENAVIVPKNIGGDPAGVQIPFEIHYNGSRTAGSFDTSTKKFTPTED